jgi:hypothetical protein
VRITRRTEQKNSTTSLEKREKEQNQRKKTAKAKELDLEDVNSIDTHAL